MQSSQTCPQLIPLIFTIEILWGCIWLGLYDACSVGSEVKTLDVFLVVFLPGFYDSEVTTASLGFKSLGALVEMQTLSMQCFPQGYLVPMVLVMKAGILAVNSKSSKISLQNLPYKSKMEKTNSPIFQHH